MSEQFPLLIFGVHELESIQKATPHPDHWLTFHQYCRVQDAAAEIPIITPFSEDAIPYSVEPAEVPNGADFVVRNAFTYQVIIVKHYRLSTLIQMITAPGFSLLGRMDLIQHMYAATQLEVIIEDFYGSVFDPEARCIWTPIGFRASQTTDKAGRPRYADLRYVRNNIDPLQVFALLQELELHGIRVTYTLNGPQLYDHLKEVIYQEGRIDPKADTLAHLIPAITRSGWQRLLTRFGSPLAVLMALCDETETAATLGISELSDDLLRTIRHFWVA
jgi:hypothetical protein